MLYVSSAYERVWGLRAADLLDDFDDLRQRIDSEDRPALDAAFEAVLRGEAATFDATYRVRLGDGKLHWVRDRGWPERDPASGAVLRIAGLAEDITVRVEAETARRAAEAALAESEERFRTLAEALPGMLFATDAAGRNIYTNNRLQHYSGLSAEELLG